MMAHGYAREGKWRGNWRMQWVASTLHTTSEHGLSSITTADAHTSAASSRLNWRPPGRFKWTRPFRAKDEIWFLSVCHHISTGCYRRWKGWRVKVTHFHLMPKLRMGGAIPLLTTYTFMASRGTVLPFSYPEGISEQSWDEGMLTEQGERYWELQDTALGWLWCSTPLTHFSDNQVKVDPKSGVSVMYGERRNF